MSQPGEAVISDDTSDQTAVEFTIAGNLGTKSVNFPVGSSVKTVTKNINEEIKSTGVAAECITYARLSISQTPVGPISLTIGTTEVPQATNNTYIIANGANTVSNMNELTGLMNAINAFTASTNIEASQNANNKQYIVLKNTSGDNILIKDFTDTGTTNKMKIESGDFSGTVWSSTTAEAISNTLGTLGQTVAGSNDLIVCGTIKFISNQSFSVTNQKDASGNPVTGWKGYLPGNTNPSSPPPP